ncbi:hypothetical protein [Limnofasciculus baicalensis]|uniref:Uncharacterized protein n=1 Tax=Limnofasciculus baicalensis BBK-W-15 TaxID=2699891 RepID=A0AAE3KR61_9CYAN|nr:hypothetical protein [Limnofasciculus baicalensis]MCP2728057.1 hypothetical protein [Limnofasciculus baicalensis BBK-W-15]
MKKVKTLGIGKLGASHFGKDTHFLPPFSPPQPALSKGGERIQPAFLPNRDAPGKWAQLGIYSTAIGLISASNAVAATLNIGFTKLPGLTGGFPASTAVYMANLSNIGFDIGSIQIGDNSGGLGGATGKFSGFDLDGIKFSKSAIANGADINSLPGLNVFDFSPSGTFFTPGKQRAPIDLTPLFGTTGSNINNTVATLNSFDANSTTNEILPGATAFGFASLGDNGKIAFNLKNLVSTTEPLYLYIGEVGDNGEVGAGEITVSDKPMNRIEVATAPTSNSTQPTQTIEVATIPTSNSTQPTQTIEIATVPTTNSTQPRKSVPEPASLVSLSFLGIYLVTYRSKKTKC